VGALLVKKLVRRWISPLAWMGLIFFVSAQPSLPSVPGRWDVLLKKGMHMLAYGILTGLYLRALRGPGRDTRRIRVVSIVLALAYALSDEYHQTFVLGRNGTLADVMIDGVGILGATLLDWLFAGRGCLRVSEVSE
jgi:VanZ family protein